MAEKRDEDSKHFGRILAELHKQITGERRQRQSFPEKTKFIPINTAYEVLQFEIEKLRELFEISARCARREVDDEENERFVRKIVGQGLAEAERAATILAIVLSLNSIRPFEPDSSVWQEFIKACGDEQESQLFRDGELPFKHQAAHKKFGRDYGGLFFDHQYKYCAPVLEIGAITAVNLQDLQAPLPYVDEEQIGSGHYGTVYAVTVARSHVRNPDKYSPPGDVTFARKDIRLPSGGTTDTTRTLEWDIFQLIRKNKHKHDEYITSILACFIFGDKVSLFMKKADMDLSKFLERPAPSFGRVQSDVMNIANVAGALDYLHREISDSYHGHIMCYHLDIKPENILVEFDDNKEPIFKLSDFSISRVKRTAISSDLKQSDFKLSDLYAPRSSGLKRDDLAAQYGASTSNKVGYAATCIPPEALQKRKVDEKADVWSFGCVLCMYLAWLCEGRKSVELFAEARTQVADACDDRFVVSSNSGYVLNTAVVDWLGQQCQNIGSSTLADNRIYESIWRLLIRQIMQIDSKQRCCMKVVHKELSDISRASPQEHEARLVDSVSTTSVMHQPHTDSIRQSQVSEAERILELDDDEMSTVSRAEDSNSAVVHDSKETEAPPAVAIASIDAIGQHSLSVEERVVDNEQSRTAVIPRAASPAHATAHGSGALSHTPIRASQASLKPFDRELRCTKHTDARADVVEQRKATLAAQSASFRESSPMGLMLGAPRVSFIPWTSPSLHKIRMLITGCKNAYLACLHEAGVTVFKVTHELEKSDSVLVTCCDRRIEGCAIGSTKLALFPEADNFELYLYDLQTLFPLWRSRPNDTVQADKSRNIEAHCIVDDIAEQPELIAMHPDSKLSSLVACLMRPNSNAERTLYLLNLDVRYLPVKRPIRAQDFKYVMWKSTFVAEVDKQHSTGHRSQLTFTSYGDRIVWTVKAEHNDITHVYSWPFETGGNSQYPLWQCIPAQSGNDISNTLINCLHLPNFEQTLAVYRYSMTVHADPTAAPTIINLPEEHIPLQALATDDFVQFYLLSAGTRDNFQIVGVSKASADIDEPLKVMSRQFMPGIQLLSAGEKLLHALLVKTGEALQMLLIWSGQHSLLVPLQRTLEKTS